MRRGEAAFTSAIGLTPGLRTAGCGGNSQKPLACGLPLGALVCNEKAAAAIGLGMHGSTFGGSALACRVALEFFDILDELMPSIERVGAYFRSALEDLGRKHSFVKEVRGRGLMIGVELTISLVSRSCSMRWRGAC